MSSEKIGGRENGGTFIEQERPRNHWFRASVESAHVGKNGETHFNYVYARDAAAAFGKAKKMRGWKRHGTVPDISQMTPEEEAALTEVIKESGGVNFKVAKRSGYYGKRKQLDGSFVSVENLIRKKLNG